MSKSLPAITHLQYVVLEAMAEADQAGRDLRALLADCGARSSAPAFYQMMGRLEDADLVEGRYEQRVVSGQHVKERRYRLTRSGERALQATRTFYQEWLAVARPIKRGSHA